MDAYSQAVMEWQKRPTPENSRRLLQLISPVIDQAVYATVGVGASPLIRSRAKVLALQVLRKYNPRMGKVNTYLSSQFQTLRRYRRMVVTPFKIPEHRQFDFAAVMDAQEELRSELGREPSVEELSAKTHLPPSRIRAALAVPAYTSYGSLAVSDDEEELSPEMLAGAPTARQQRLAQRKWLETIYHDLGDPINKKIMEWKYGLFDKPILPGKEIARKLGITPAAVSQRWKQIESFVNSLEEVKPV